MKAVLLFSNNELNPSKTTTWQTNLNHFHFVYLFESISHPGNYYTGNTSDIEKRLIKHNAVSFAHTSKFRPWKIKNFFAFDDRIKVIAFEKYLKSGSGREFARRHF